MKRITGTIFLKYPEFSDVPLPFLAAQLFPRLLNMCLQCKETTAAIPDTFTLPKANTGAGWDFFCADSASVLQSIRGLAEIQNFWKSYVGIRNKFQFFFKCLFFFFFFFGRGLCINSGSPCFIGSWRLKGFSSLYITDVNTQSKYGKAATTFELPESRVTTLIPQDHTILWQLWDTEIL